MDLFLYLNKDLWKGKNLSFDESLVWLDEVLDLIRYVVEIEKYQHGTILKVFLVGLNLEQKLLPIFLVEMFQVSSSN
jgi:hypothetical protein